MERIRWPDGFRCLRCGGQDHGLVYGRRLKPHQCRTCGHQATPPGCCTNRRCDLPE
ncbi:transposase [Synechococcus sp. BA-132 BA5]|uniref:transposase n=1 Tax=Synechococcus sp. BA-132 BA5 TaxID=3110252 RepID=UPI003FCE031A